MADNEKVEETTTPEATDREEPTSTGGADDEVPIEEGEIGVDSLLQAVDPVGGEEVGKSVPTDKTDDPSVAELTAKQRTAKKPAETPKAPAKVDKEEATVKSDSSLSEETQHPSARTDNAKLQSKVDKAQNEVEFLRKQLGMLQDVKPIAELIVSKPEILEFIDGYMKGQPLPDIPGQLKEPTVPEAPKKPAGYNLDDALSDGQSESALWIESNNAFPAKLAEYQREKTTYDDATRKQDDFVKETQRYEQNIQAGIREALTRNPATKDGDIDEQLAKVQQICSNRDAITPDVLVNTYLSSNLHSSRTTTPEEALTDVKTEAHKRAEELKAKGEKKAAPIPPSVVTDEVTEQIVESDKDYSDAFEKSLLS